MKMETFNLTLLRLKIDLMYIPARNLSCPMSFVFYEKKKNQQKTKKTKNKNETNQKQKRNGSRMLCEKNSQRKQYYGLDKFCCHSSIFIVDHLEG